MEQYLNLCRFILDNGVWSDNRTGIPTKSIFGYQMHFNLTQGFPLITTKKINLKAIIYELLWFIKGDTNIRYLVLNNVNIWNEWPYRKYCQSSVFQQETLEEFRIKIQNDEQFALKYGDLGPVYGKQWRNFLGIDQLKNLITEIKHYPNSRRLIISAWNPFEIKDMALPPCHVLMQFNVIQKKISLQLYQRSGDVFLGVPFNIASYSLLLLMVAQVTNLEPSFFVHTLGNAHIYQNHIMQIKTQLQRKPYPLPYMILNRKIKNIEDFCFHDFILKNYISYGILKGKVAV